MMRNFSLSVVIVLAVSSTASAATLFFDFGGTTTTGGNYNDVTFTQDPIFNALDSTGTPTGIGLATSGFNEIGSNTGGTQAPTGDAAIFDIQATRDSLFGHSSNFNAGGPRTPGVLEFSNLDGSGATAYDFTIFASRLNSGTTIRDTQYDVVGLNSATTYLDPANNESNVAVVSGIVPTAAGNITITVSAGPNNSTSPDLFFYLGAMKVDSVAVPEPSTVALLALGAAVCGAAWRRS